MTDTAQQQPQQASPVEIEARFKAMREQRDSAMDRLVIVAGEVALLQDKLASQAKMIAQLMSEKSTKGA